MIYLIVFACITLVIIAITAISNVLIFPRLNRANEAVNHPVVSILIPARNEAKVIGETLRHLVAQTYHNVEIIVLDDHSEDATGKIILGIATQCSNLRIISGDPLPEGWIGKSWACHQLSQEARGDIFIFTDADVRWKPDALANLIAKMQDTQADLLTVWSTQTTITWSERLIVPLIAMSIIGYLPVIMTHYSPFASFAAANGQCMAWKRDAYKKLGGHQVVSNNVLDDVTHARLAKRSGLRIRMVDAAGLIHCRMYSNWRDVSDGFAKNILAGYGGRVSILIFATIFHLLLFIAPWVWLLFDEYRWWAVALIAMGFGVRVLSAAFTRQRILDAFLLPLSVLLMTVIAVKAIWWHYTGGVRWKGRRISQQVASSGVPNG